MHSDPLQQRWDENEQKAFQVRFPSRTPLQRRLLSWVEAPLQRLFLLDQLNQLVDEAGRRTSDGRPFADRFLSLMNISYEVVDEDRKRIPATGPVIAVAIIHSAGLRA